jgi:flavin-dependent thymidylate synthase
MMMRVTLVNYTHDALNLLLRTKNTRLTNADDPATWSAEKRQEHLDYMRDTIKSSWEFVDLTFQIDGVTRAFTHQLVRTRTGSYAQQAMRVVDARNQDVEEPPSIVRNPDWHQLWKQGQRAAMAAYGDLIDHGAPAQDSRGILPTHITTSIMAKFNLRTLHEMAKLRLCTRTQGEYQDVFREMRRLLIGVWPWAEEFIEVHCVATGTCAFPRYGKTECPVYVPAMDNTAVRETARRIFWAVRHEAAPVAVDGKAM